MEKDSWLEEVQMLDEVKMSQAPIIRFEPKPVAGIIHFDSSAEEDKTISANDHLLYDPVADEE